MSHRQKIFFIVVGSLIVLLALAIRLQDSDGRLAAGTTIGGIDVGGQLPKGAEIKLEEKAHWKGLEAEVNGKRSKLREVQAVPEAQESVNKALQDSEDRSFFSKIMPGGGKDYALSWKYSKKVLAKELAWLKRENDRPPVNASPVYIGNGKIRIRRGKMGRTLPWKPSLLSLEKVAGAGGGVAVLQKQTEAPKALDRGESASVYPNLLIVDRAARTLYYYKNLRLAKTYNVAVGQPGFETPTGYFHVTSKSVNPAWLPPDWAGSIAGQLVAGGSPENPLIARWMGVANGVGFHGTSDLASLGSAASHGCIRMDPADIIPLYNKIPVGTPVIITR